MTDRADLRALSDNLLSALEPFSKLEFSFDGFSFQPAELVVNGRCCGRFLPNEHHSLQVMINNAVAAVAAYRTGLLLPAPSYTDDDYRRLHAQLVEVTRERDEARDALTEIRDAWTARARLSDEDGIQALKDIAREALK